EAVDGLEAVEQARALRPDIILLDAGMPRLDGIEAARRIIAHRKNACILLLSEHRSPDIVTASLQAGARGYVVKSEAARELLPAMKAVLEGHRFVSACLGALAADTLNGGQLRHEIGLYPDAESLIDDYARIARSALARGDTFVILAEPARCDHLRE